MPSGGSMIWGAGGRKGRERERGFGRRKKKVENLFTPSILRVNDINLLRMDILLEGIKHNYTPRPIRSFFLLEK